MIRHIPVVIELQAIRCVVETLGADVVILPIIDMLRPRPHFLPQAIPSSIASRLVRLHGHPFVWWIGQILSYILRPQPSLSAEIKNTASKLQFRHPIVGLAFCHHCRNYF